MFAVLLFSGIAVGSWAADAGAGEHKAQICSACHGVAGKSEQPQYPILAGQPAQAIAMALFEFREGKRKNEQMNAIAANLTNADLNDLAAYFSSQAAPPPQRQTTPELAEMGRALTVKNACIACHGSKLLGQQQMPRLAGQHQAYLQAQLIAFKNTTRTDLDGTMSSAAQALTVQDIDILADYLSGLPSQ